MGIFGGDRRRKIVVDRQFQVRATLIGMIYIVAVAVCLSLPLVNTMRSIGVLLEGRSQDLVTFYRTQQTYTILSLALFFVGILGAWTVFMLWRTHKIAGPLVKITRHVHQFATGNFTERIRLREKDQLQALANTLNDMASSLEERDRAIKEEILSQVNAVKQTLHANPASGNGTRVIDQLLASVGRSFEAKWEAPVPTEDAQEEPVYS
ncbi:MAG: HAMP domain-containing protein [Candidatus Krumholzibacteria bacterium]|nr:HAMP domain-containing protein [Candidatus Krumholzibacteria bacterium]